MRSIVIADGDGSRWRRHRGVPKHLVQVDGEQLLDRIIRLFSPHGEVIVVGPPEYRREGVGLYIPVHDWGRHRDVDKFLNSRALWDHAGRTVVVYGDVYFTEAAVATIAAHEAREWRLFCRFGPNDYTGRAYGECFAQSFYPEHIEEHEAALWRVARLHDRLGRSGGWEHYRAMCGLPDGELRRHDDYGRATDIHDWTDDFDTPEDYDEFTARRQHHRPDVSAG